MGEKKDTLITLTVDTGKINNNNINSCVVFSDDRKEDKPQEPGNPKDYVSTVNRNKKVTWQGKAKEGSDTVKILEVYRKKEDGGAEIVEKFNSKNDGTVEGKIKDKKVDGLENYEVKFSINGGDPYPVDPKLAMKD